ncbi:MAG: glucose-1-phosphate adenylyltransferase [Bacteroidetes bacterium]|nr:glucose-1-phosphate adenylyltransferase [Bacteroidota bacterium]
MKEILAVILAGGKGERLSPLTRDRSKPAVPFGGIYRIIDITLSNCINSEIYKIMVFPQYRGQSLVDHIEAGWNIFSLNLGHFIKIVHPQLAEQSDMYRGTADSVRHNLKLINHAGVEYILILSGDHIYKMDYQRFLDFHLASEADVSVAVKEVPAAEAHRFGVVVTDPDFRVTGFQEKPKDPATLPGKPGSSLISMGIYLFSLDFLNKILKKVEGHDFGHDVIPAAVEQGSVMAYSFDQFNRIRDYAWVSNEDGSRTRVLQENTQDAFYWRDVGDLDSYWQANMDLTGVSPGFSLYGTRWPLRTFQQQYPPVKTVFNNRRDYRVGAVLDSIISPGSIVSGGTVLNSVLSYNVRVNSWAQVEDCVIFSDVEIGRHTRVRRCIIDKHNYLPHGISIGYDEQEDRKHYTVTPGGIVVIGKRTFRRPGED